ncbi:Uncharacterised protein g7948 [Pycnogonum litorale]
MKRIIIIQLIFVVAITAGDEITCSCTTSLCQAQNVTTCNTTSMCYSQYLDLRDGSDPTVSGCITSKTPLLCENRRPSSVRLANWPILSCCKTNMCNENTPTASTGSATSTTSPSMEKKRKPMKDETSAPEFPGTRLEDIIRLKEVKSGFGKSSGHDGRPLPTNDHIISPVYVTVLVVGIFSLIIIGAIAIYMLRRRNRFYDTEYGTVARNGYLKGHYTTSVGCTTSTRPLAVNSPDVASENETNVDGHAANTPERTCSDVYENKLIIGS